MLEQTVVGQVLFKLSILFIPLLTFENLVLEYKEVRICYGE